MKKIRWLQISDLHILDMSQWNIMQTQYSELNQIRGAIDFIVITGDLHQYGDDYKKTLDFLNYLSKNLDVKKEDIFILPGNHDIDKEIKKDIVREICSHPDKPDYYLKYYDILTKRYDKFLQFLEDFYGKKPEIARLIQGYSYIFWQRKINLILINSTFLCDGDRGHDLIVDIKSLSQLEVNNPYPTIMFGHHSLESLIDIQKKELYRIIEHNSISAYICGDTHRASENEILTNDSFKFKEVICGKSSCEIHDDFSDVGCVLYEYENDKVEVIPYVWNKRTFHLDRSHMFDKDESHTAFFSVHFKNTEKNQKEYISQNDSIWLPDAEKASGEQARFKSFTKTESVKKFLESKEDFWGISSVKGMGKTFLLQVKRMSLSKSVISIPYVSKPNAANNWATEYVNINNLQNFTKNNVELNDLKMFWKFSVVCYMIRSWVSYQNSLAIQDRSSSLRTIENYIVNNKDKCPTFYEIYTDIGLNNLDSIMEHLLEMDKWKNVVVFEYTILKIIGRQIASDLENQPKKKCLILFLDKLDQSMDQPTSEQSQCEYCKKTTPFKCTNSKKSIEYCNQCESKSNCCYGCDIYEDIFAGTCKRVFPDTAEISKAHISYWQLFQLALIVASSEMKNEYTGHLKVAFTVRQEAFNCGFNLLGVHTAKIMSPVTSLEYTKAEQLKIYNDCIKNQKKMYLYDSKASFNEDNADYIFAGVRKICHPYVTGSTESIFDIIYRHSFGRTRDIQDYGVAITQNINYLRGLSREEDRENALKDIIEERAALLAYNNKLATQAVGDSYYVQILKNMPNYWRQNENFENLIKEIDRNLLLFDDIEKICKKINFRKGKCTADQCKKCVHQPFSMLYKMGYLGIVYIKTNNQYYQEQDFIKPLEVTYFHETSALEIHDYMLYLLHPALTKTIERMNFKRIKHCNAFIIGRDLQVPSEIIKTIISDKKELTSIDFEKKYYNN